MNPAGSATATLKHQQKRQVKNLSFLLVLDGGTCKERKRRNSDCYCVAVNRVHISTLRQGLKRQAYKRNPLHEHYLFLQGIEVKGLCLSLVPKAGLEPKKQIYNSK